MGLQTEEIGGRPVWVLPNPSGLNAHYKPADFARLYAEARAYADALAAPPAAAAAGPSGSSCESVPVRADAGAAWPGRRTEGVPLAHRASEDAARR